MDFEVWLEPNKIGFCPVEEIEGDLGAFLGFVQDLKEDCWG